MQPPHGLDQMINFRRIRWIEFKLSGPWSEVGMITFLGWHLVASFTSYTRTIFKDYYILFKDAKAVEREKVIERKILPEYYNWKYENARNKIEFII